MSVTMLFNVQLIVEANPTDKAVMDGPLASAQAVGEEVMRLIKPATLVRIKAISCREADLVPASDKEN
jgi:hypothetical protein